MDKRAELDELRARRAAEEKVGRKKIVFCFCFHDAYKARFSFFFRCTGAFARTCNDSIEIDERHNNLGVTNPPVKQTKKNKGNGMHRKTYF